MRKLLALGVAVAFFLAGAGHVFAAAGTGPIGARCYDSNPRYKGTALTADLDFDLATCQTQEYCREHAPKKNSYFWDPQSPDCSNAQNDPGGCCAYYKQPPPPPPLSGSEKTLFNPIEGVSSLFGVTSRAITVFLGVVGALAFAVFIYAGVTWMTSGSSDRVQKAKNAMKYAVIGLLLIALSYAITTFVISAFTNQGS
jgi:hypothetical protein